MRRQIIFARYWFERLLELVTILMMVALAVVVIVAVGFRLAGHALAWYDEVAAIQLAWLTYYGGALAALKRAHISVPALVNGAPPVIRVPLVLFSEAVIIGFFALLAWFGYEVLLVLEGDTLISLPEVSVQFTQSVIPIGAVLFILAQLLTLPEMLDEAIHGKAHSQTEGVEP